MIYKQIDNIIGELDKINAKIDFLTKPSKIMPNKFKQNMPLLFPPLLIMFGLFIKSGTIYWLFTDFAVLFINLYFFFRGRFSH